METKKGTTKEVARSILLGIAVAVFFCVEISSAQTLLWDDMYLEDLPFTVRDSCSDHAYFNQAAAREDGAFIVVSRNHAPNQEQEKAFYQVYIDLYDSKGLFQQEFTFPCPLDFTAELREDWVHMYFYSFVFSFHLENGELEYREIPPQSFRDSDRYKELRKTTFTCGEWQYRYVKRQGEYTGLVRYNGGQTQSLIELPGTGNAFWINWAAQMTLGIAIICLWRLFRKRRKDRK